MKDNVSGINSAEKTKPSQNQKVSDKQESAAAKNSGTNDHVVVIHLSDYAKNTCQTMKKTTSEDQADTDRPNLTEQINPGLRVINDSESNVRIGPSALLESIAFSKDSIEEYISAGLRDKMKKAGTSLVAIELGYMINSFSNKNGSTVEERAITREIGRRLAEYFIQTFIDDPVEKKERMAGINGFAERDMMLEKGYYFWEGKAYEIYKPVPISIFFKKTNTRWSKKTVDAFKANEKEVAASINAAISAIKNDTVSAKLEQILAKYNRIANPVSNIDVPSGVQWFIDLQNKRYA
jgi:hypothetical protein